MDFVQVLIELSSLGVTAEIENRRFDPKFRSV